MADQDYSPEWGDYADQLGIDMYDLASASAEKLMPPVPIQFVSTTGNIVTIAFIPYRAFPEEGILWIEFHNGPYRFFDVPLETAMGFDGAPSATLYFNTAIRDAFDYEGG